MLRMLSLVAIVCIMALAQGVTPTVEIAPGVYMPKVNLGTCCGSDPSIGIPSWLEAGGTGIDTAWDYHDEGKIATALANVNRSSVFITTKVPAGVGADLSHNATDCSADPQVALNYVKSNLQQLGTDYVDLVLLHGPCRFADPPVQDPVAADNALWRGLEMAMQQGLTRAIGVSNYVSKDLAALTGKVKPAVNQCMMSVNYTKPLLPVPPHGHDDETIAYCEENNITYEAWRVIGGCPMEDSRITAIARAHNRSAAQVCLKYVLQRGAIIAAGTGSDPVKAKAHARDNLDSFTWALTTHEMDVLSSISP